MAFGVVPVLSRPGTPAIFVHRDPKLFDRNATVTPESVSDPTTSRLSLRSTTFAMFAQPAGGCRRNCAIRAAAPPAYLTAVGANPPETLSTPTMSPQKLIAVALSLISFSVLPPRSRILPLAYENARHR